MIAVITGEGGSAAARWPSPAANRVLMLEHAIYSVITPEGCASILLRDGTKAEGAAKAMKITAQDLIGFKIIDRIIPEPLGGAHADPAATIKAVGDAIEEELKALLPLSARRAEGPARGSASWPSAAEAPPSQFYDDLIPTGRISSGRFIGPRAGGDSVNRWIPKSAEV